MRLKKQIRSFLLLEMMIAIFLVTVSISPFLKSTFTYFRSELKQLELIEAQRIAELSFFEIKQKLYQNEIAWDDIPKLQTESSIFSLDPFPTEIPGFDPKDIQRNYIIWGPPKEGTANKHYKKVHILLSLDIPGHDTPKIRVQERVPPSPYQF